MALYQNECCPSNSLVRWPFRLFLAVESALHVVLAFPCSGASLRRFAAFRLSGMLSLRRQSLAARRLVQGRLSVPSEGHSQIPSYPRIEHPLL